MKKSSFPDRCASGYHNRGKTTPASNAPARHANGAIVTRSQRKEGGGLMKSRALLVLLATLVGVLALTFIPSGRPASAATYASVDAGARHTCALTSSNGVQCWGSNEYGQLGDGTGLQRLAPVTVPGLTNVTARGRRRMAQLRAVERRRFEVLGKE